MVGLIPTSGFSEYKNDAMKYDDASWHVSEDDSGEVNPFAGATHIGMFLAWAASRNLLGALHTEEFPTDLEQLRSRSFTPGAWFMENCDGKFTNEDLNEEGNFFAQSYYESTKEGMTPAYFQDYADTFRDLDIEMYQVPDTWETFDRIAPVIDSNFNEWKKKTGKKPTLWETLGLRWLKPKK